MENTKEEEKLPILSYSKVTSYKDCPKKYKFAYIDKVKRKDHTYTIFGSFCHEVLEKFHRYYLENKSEDNSTTPFEDIMRQSFKEARDNWKAKITKDQLVEAYNILLDYLTLVTDQATNQKDEIPEIVAVEKKIWLPIDNEFVFYGFIDRVQIDKDGIVHVVDYKSGNPKYLTDRTQLLLYGYSLMVEDEDIKKIRSSYMLLKHNFKPLQAEHTADELIEAKNKLLHNWQTIKSDKLFRATPIAYKCKMCDYVDICDEGKKVTSIKTKTFGKVKF